MMETLNSIIIIFFLFYFFFMVVCFSLTISGAQVHVKINMFVQYNNSSTDIPSSFKSKKHKQELQVHDVSVALQLRT